MGISNRGSEMGEWKKWAKLLEQLRLRNSKVNNYYRMATGAVRDPKLKQSLLKYATTRAQFSFELSQRIQTIGGTSDFELKDRFGGAAISLYLSEENLSRILQKSILAEKECLVEYSKALTKINDGATREILIRHRAGINSILRELQHLNALIPFSGKSGSIKIK